MKVKWESPPALAGSEGVYDAMRAAKTDDKVVLERGNAADAIGAAPFKVSYNCRAPYQAHAPFGPNCALADVKSDSALVMCSTQDVYGTRTSLARVLGLPVAKVRFNITKAPAPTGIAVTTTWRRPRPCSHNSQVSPCASSSCAGMSTDGTTTGRRTWARSRLLPTMTGRSSAYEYHGWHHNWSAVETSEQLALGKPASEWPGAAAQQVNPVCCGGMYEIPNVRLVNHHVPGLSYLKAAWLRSPLDLSFAFTSEQAIDQLAFLLKLDPYEFRRRNIKDDRWRGVLDAAAQAAKWTPRPAGANLSRGKIVSGRGIGMGTHLVSYGAAVAEIQINRQTGVVSAKHLYGAIDAGLVVNPGNVESQIGGQLVQTASRMLKEEVTFSKTNVTSLDWASYPILRFEECPQVTPVVVQQLNERSTGAGEEVMAAAAGAMANAFFDATGVRITEFPMTPKRVLAALTHTPQRHPVE